jgi:hypothetical protein
MIEAKADEGSEMNQVEFSAARYEPMARLMSDEDLLFLKAQPGFRPEMGKKFSRERRQIFRLYLQELARDFHRLHAHARLIVASLPADHSPLVAMLIRQQLRFWYELAAIEMHLSFEWASAASIDARALVNALATMHAEISRVAAPTAA